MPGYLDVPPLAFAHRGGAGTAGNVGIENSLAAFSHAYALGYRYLETDVRCSLDGVVYAVHDASLERLTGSTDSVHVLTSDALDLLRLDGREPFVRLQTLYETFPDARLNIDVKSEDAVAATCAVVEAQGAVERTCLCSFSHARLSRIRATLPAVATSASRREAICVKFLPLPVLRRWAPLGAICLQVPARRGPLAVVTARFLRRAHALGLQVHVWTIDDPAEMHRLLDLGVDGIITDRTDVLKDVLVDRGSWREP